MKKILWAFAALLAFAYSAFAQNLPAGSLGVVSSNTPNTWQSYSYTFTPSTTGANFIGFAFRQDPAFWTFDNVRLTASGSSTNLLTNGAFDHGGSFNVTTTNGPSSIQAPTSWGVWYQNGTYPSAAGTWTDIGSTHGGVWYDGAVGSFDGIYQGVNLTAGTTYTITFDVSGNHTSNGGSVQLGIYGGACADVSIASTNCTIPSSVGFTTLATPAQGEAAGGPATPTLVSEVPTTSTVTSSTVYGTPTVVTRVVDGSVNDRVRFTVTRTSTPITTRTFTTTTVTTPHTLQTYSDGSTVTTDGTATTSTTNGATVTTGNSTSQTGTASSNTLKDALAINRFNLFLIDPLSTKDGAWAKPTMSYAKAGGSLRSGGFAGGYQKTVDSNTFGFGFSFDQSTAGNYINATNESSTSAGNAYLLNKQKYVWVKGSVGFSSGNFSTTTSIPQFALANSNKVTQNNYYGDLTLYSDKTLFGVRPLLGVTTVAANVKTKSEYGSPLLSTVPENGTKTETRPYAGLRYDITEMFGVETRLTHSKDFNTVTQVRANVNKEVFKNVLVEAGVGFDRSSNYTGVAGNVGLKINF